MKKIIIEIIPDTNSATVTIDGKEVDNINSINVSSTPQGVWVNIAKSTLKEQDNISGLIGEI